MWRPLRPGLLRGGMPLRSPPATSRSRSRAKPRSARSATYISGADPAQLSTGQHHLRPACPSSTKKPATACATTRRRAMPKSADGRRRRSRNISPWGSHDRRRRGSDAYLDSLRSARTPRPTLCGTTTIDLQQFARLFALGAEPSASPSICALAPRMAGRSVRRRSSHAVTIRRKLAAVRSLFRFLCAREPSRPIPPAAADPESAEESAAT